MYTIPNFAGPTSSGGSSPMPYDSPTFQVPSYGSGAGAGYGGSNQYGSYPSMGGYPPSTSGYNYGPQSPTAPPGVVPPSTSGAFPSPTGYVGNNYTSNLTGGPGAVGAAATLPGGAGGGPTMDPLFTQAYDAYLRSQLGQGVAPFDLSAILPSSGMSTQAGTLTAPNNALMNSLQNFYLGQGGGPNSFILPMWQSQMQALQQPIEQQYADIKEQFSGMGALGSSEMATALGNYGAQTAAQEQAMLGQDTLQALPGMQQQAQIQQQLDQASINNMLQEFIRTSPQYNPMLGMEQQLATTFPPIYTKQGGVGSAILGAAGPIMQGIGSMGSAAALLGLV